MVAVVSEIINQADLGNHDQEVNHARMRHRLEVGQGKEFGFANAAFAHLGQEIGIRHSALTKKVKRFPVKRNIRNVVVAARSRRGQQSVSMPGTHM